ncbi:MAG: DUF3047 domain-containing protein, partial [Nitrospirae bacterium]
MIMKFKLFFTVLIALTVFSANATTTRQKMVLDNFEDGLGKKWEEKVFKDKTVYEVINIEGNNVLRAESNNAASGLIYKYEFSPKDYPFITWRWKVENIIKNGDATKKEGDDYPARLYIVFP